MRPRDVEPTPKLVIFDCDGVLVDSEEISSAVMADAIIAAGLKTSAEEVRTRYQGMPLADIGADIEQRLGTALPNDFWDRFETARATTFEASLTAINGAHEAVTAVQAAGIRTCVASQARLAKTQLTLHLAGLRDLFADNELFSAYTVPRGKPFPDLFLHAADAIDISPSNCLVVEDSPTGIRAAIAAGMSVVAFIPNGADSPAPDPAVHTIQRLTELILLLTHDGEAADPT